MYIHKGFHRSFCNGNNHVCITWKHMCIWSPSGIIFKRFIKMLLFSLLFLQMARIHVWGILAHIQHEDMHSQTRLEVELLCSCNLTSKVVQCNAMKFTKNLMHCIHLEDTKTLWENHNSPWWNVKGHYVDVHSMSCKMVEPCLFHSS